MGNAIFKVPKPENEPVRTYRAGSEDRKNLIAEIEKIKNSCPVFPIKIGKTEHRTNKIGTCVCPHDLNQKLCEYHIADEEVIKDAIKIALEAKEKWMNISWEQRIAIFLRMAELVAGPYRMRLNAAATMEISKNVHQAEIDAVCETIDFLRFNCKFTEQLYSIQPESSPGMWNQTEYRPLEGFMVAITPFNFVSIMANLSLSPALMGNVVIWKPSRSTIYIANLLMELFKEAGMPDGVITMIPTDGETFSKVVFNHPDFAGLHFTGSKETFDQLQGIIGVNIAKSVYKNYPRVVGETGGKDFIFVHNSAKIVLKEIVVAAIRAAFEFQGQKCSAASRMYMPKSLWPEFQKLLLEEVQKMRMGSPEDFRNFVNAVIDKSAFKRIKGYIEYARNLKNAMIIAGGKYDNDIGYFVQPTIILTTNPRFKTMEEEIFGPVLTILVYPDQEYEKYLEICDKTSPYALTGAIFALDQEAKKMAIEKLKYSAGNFYINDKCTAAVVGQQPFGGARGSGTNDKAGSIFNLIRWVSMRTIKETFVPPKEWTYPFME